MGDVVHAPIGKVQAEEPRELTIDDISKLPEEYRRAAQCAKDAGFDGVEVHAANGYLLDCFLQTSTNKRADKYGGSNENRFRVIGEILDAVCTVFPSSAVGIRFSPNGAFNDMGSKDFREIFTDYMRRLNSYNLGYLHVLDGLGFGFHQHGEPMMISDMRKTFNGKLMGNCGYTKQQAVEALAAGYADFVSFGRPYITNPDLVERFKANAKLADDADPATWYGAVDSKSKYYIEYPPMEQAA